MVGSLRRGSARRGRSRGRGKRGRITENEQVEDMSSQSHPSGARQFTPKIIRTPDDLETVTSPCTHGSTLIMRVIENESDYTRTEQPTQTFERHLSPILGISEFEDQDHSHSRLEISSSDSILQGAEEQKYVETPLYLKSGSHKSNSAEKENAMDNVFEGALVAGGTEHNTSIQLENSNSGMEVIFSPSNSHEESHHGYPSPTDVHENVGSNSTNNGSKETAIEKSKTFSASSLINTAQIFEDLGFGTNFEVESMGPGNALVSLNGYKYKVKAQYVSLLTSILSKHGDIGRNCSMESVTFLSICMEHVCDIVQTLQNTNLKEMTKNKLESLMASITDIEEERVDVGWLRKRLDEISDAEKVILELKKRHGEQLTKVEMIKEQLEEYKRAIVDLQKKVNLGESDLSVAMTEVLDLLAMTEVSETEYSISEKAAKIKHVYTLESLAHGLV